MARVIVTNKCLLGVEFCEIYSFNSIQFNSIQFQFNKNGANSLSTRARESISIGPITRQYELSLPLETSFYYNRYPEIRIKKQLNLITRWQF